jgi:hypothetical protein
MWVAKCTPVRGGGGRSCSWPPWRWQTRHRPSGYWAVVRFSPAADPRETRNSRLLEAELLSAPSREGSDAEPPFLVADGRARGGGSPPVVPGDLLAAQPEEPRGEPKELVQRGAVASSQLVKKAGDVRPVRTAQRGRIAEEIIPPAVCRRRFVWPRTGRNSPRSRNPLLQARLAATT